MKHCTDCRFFRPKQDSSPEYGLCTHDKSKREDASDKMIAWLVCGSGEQPPDEVQWTYAPTMRRFDCGIEGKLFDPKPDAEAAAERRKDHDFDAKGQQ